jgi:hypothetical protein
MEPDQKERRRDERFPIEAGATVEVSGGGSTMRATTIDMSGSGVLLDFAAASPLAPGDRVDCEFQVAHESGSPLPYWGVGRVVRVDGPRVAVELVAGGFAPLEPGGDCPPGGDS